MVGKRNKILDCKNINKLSRKDIVSRKTNVFGIRRRFKYVETLKSLRIKRRKER